MLNKTTSRGSLSILLEKWGDENIQLQLKSCKETKSLYDYKLWHILELQAMKTETTAAARQLHEREAEHEHEGALLSALVVRCERVDQLTMFD